MQAETFDGFTFTPRYGPDGRPTIWDPAEWNGQIPRGEVNAAVDELFSRYKVSRMYCDPHDWYSEIGDWSLKYGDENVFEWNTSRIAKMYDEIRRFEVDLREGRLTHDGCPLVTIHAANARKVAKPAQRYLLGKPSQHQKIDGIMARIIAHTAASDARAEGWSEEETDTRMWCF